MVCSSHCSAEHLHSSSACPQVSTISCQKRHLKIMIGDSVLICMWWGFFPCSWRHILLLVSLSSIQSIQTYIKKKKKKKKDTENTDLVTKEMDGNAAVNIFWRLWTQHWQGCTMERAKPVFSPLIGNFSWIETQNVLCSCLYFLCFMSIWLISCAGKIMGTEIFIRQTHAHTYTCRVRLQNICIIVIERSVLSFQ